MKSFVSKHYPKLLLPLLVLAAYWPVSLHIRSMKWDIMDLGLPWRHYLGECVQNGLLPLWNPFMNMGFPQMGHWETWYPISWVIGGLFGYNLLSLQYEYLLHIAIAGYGMYALAGHFSQHKGVRLFAAISFMLSGFFVSQAQHLGYIVAVSWMPWIFYHALKFTKAPTWHHGILWAACMSLLLSGGYPGYFVTMAYLLLALWFYRAVQRRNEGGWPNWLLAHVGVGAAFALLSSVVLVSSFEVKPFINRGDPLPFTQEVWGILSGSTPAKGAWGLLFPFAVGGDKAWWGESLSLLNAYTGLLPLVLAAVALVAGKWRARLLIGLAAAAMLTAMATTFPLRYWAYVALPFMDYFRFSAMFRIYTMLFLVLGAAVLFERLRTNELPRRSLIIGLAVVAVPVLWGGIALLATPDFTAFETLKTNGWADFLQNAPVADRFVFQAAVHLLVLAVAAWLLMRFSGNARIRGLLVLATADVFLAVQLNLRATVTYDFPPSEVDTWIAEVPTDYPTPTLEATMSELTDKTPPLPPMIGRNINVIRKMPSSDGYGPYGLLAMRKSMGEGVYEQAIAHPLVYAARCETRNDSLFSVQEIPEAEVEINEFNPNKIEFNVRNLPPEAHVVYLQNTYPAWRATVDGQPAAVEVIDHAFMAVKPNAASATVAFEFKPTAVLAAFWQTAVAWALLLCWWIVACVRTIRKRPAS